MPKEDGAGWNLTLVLGRVGLQRTGVGAALGTRDGSLILKLA